MGTSNFLESVASPCVGALGLVLNVLAFRVLLGPTSRLRLRPVLRVLLVALTSSDTACIIGLTLMRKFFSMGLHDSTALPRIYVLGLYLNHVAVDLSVYLVVAVSAERFRALCLEKKRGEKAALFLAPPLAAAIALNVPKFFEFSIVEAALDGDTKYNLIASTLRRHPAYITWYIGVARFFTACLMPVVTLLVLNGAIIRRIRSSLSMSAPLTWHQPRGGSSSSATDTVYLSGVRREVQVASMLVAVVAMFIACHSIRFLLNTSEMVMYLGRPPVAYPGWFNSLIPVSHLLLLVNAGANTIVYCFADPQFRAALKESLSCCCCSRNRAPVDLEQDGVEKLEEGAADDEEEDGSLEDMTQRSSEPPDAEGTSSFKPY